MVPRRWGAARPPVPSGGVTDPDAAPLDPPFGPDDPGEHPNAPRRGALLLAFLGIVTAGLLGGMIGWGLVDVGCVDSPTLGQRLLDAAPALPGYEPDLPSCTAALVAGSLIGALLAAAGAAVVAVLILRAQAEWKQHPPKPTA